MSYYAYLNVTPPTQSQGDVYFGDGTGFALAAILAVPMAAALVSVILLPVLWRRRQH